MSRPERTLLMLGGADIQVGAIIRAKELGYRVVTCDYLPDNPGHRHADAYFEVSTTDKEAVLALARRIGIDGISAYASDPAAVTAAFVAEHLGLPGDPYTAVACIQDKSTFRRLQQELGIPSPQSLAIERAADLLDTIGGWRHGGVIKPVDTSGSKGIHRLATGLSQDEAERLFTDARSFSRSKKVIMEEFLVRRGMQMTGDVLINEGLIRFWCFGDVHFNDRINGLVPRGVTLPGSVPEHQVRRAMADLQRILDALRIRQGVFNVDLFVDEDDRPILIDVGARNGGNMLNALYQKRTGVDLITLSLRQCMGEPVDLDQNVQEKGFVGHAVIHAETTGVLRSIEISPHIAPFIFHRSVNVRPGDRVGRFVNSGHRLGLLLLEFPDQERMLDAYAHMHEHIIVNVDAC
ncbi:MAG: carbamoyl-phosphate-synthetase [Bacteroidetes bacterium]|nr:carbamoyl-phosphate-synthetase [Bacteroidota bacterium]